MKEDLFYLLDDYWHFIFYGLALLFAVFSIWELRDYRRESERVRVFIERCVSCKAEVVRPVVMDFSYRQAAKSAADVAADLAGIPLNFNAPKNYVKTMVRYTADGRTIETVIKRRSGFRHPKVGTEIAIFYDPLLPQHAFGEDMRKRMLREPLKKCIEYVLLTIFYLLCGITWHLIAPILM